MVVDCGNGVAGVIAPRLIESLGCKVIPLYCEVDGTFPNQHPDPGKPENLQDLIAKVREEQADLGLAFDGDADRVLFVDPQGREADGDHVLGFLGPWLLARGELPGATLVATVMSNLGLQRALAARGVPVVTTCS